MEIPLYSDGLAVRITNVHERFVSWLEKEEELGIPNSSTLYHKDYLEHTYRVVSSFMHPRENTIVYHIKSDKGCEILIAEKGISKYSVFGHKYIGEICTLEDGKLYDVEEWTPIAGGNFVGLVAVKITPKEVKFFVDKDKEDSHKWAMGSHWFPWRNGIRVVPHTPRKYLVDHENKCPGGVYDFSKDDKQIAMYKLLNYASKDFDNSERIFNLDDVNRIVADEVEKKLEKIKGKLTTKQAEFLTKGLNRI